jgi:hypothetical protein
LVRNQKVRATVSRCFVHYATLMIKPCTPEVKSKISQTYRKRVEKTAKKEIVSWYYMRHAYAGLGVRCASDGCLSESQSIIQSHEWCC